MKVQDKMALMGAGSIVDVSHLAQAPASDGGASQKSRQSAPASKNEPAVSLG